MSPNATANSTPARRSRSASTASSCWPPEQRCHVSTRTTRPERLADRRIFPLDVEKWVAFKAALDAPKRDLPRLKRLLSEPSIFPDDQAVSV
ncbi:DUF1778 domain-containing protein [Mesorhizobium sp. M7A.F.Ca.US.001.01.1.1]|nr:DUF1778 domain-containing protein [Mesorhizobium sp. M7A.F.Ca.US.001.01.1.1]